MELQPLADFLLVAALVLYGVTGAVALWRPQGSVFLVAFAVSVHLGAMVVRGVAIGYLPLTNKLESFSAAALGVGVALLLSFRPRRAYVVPLLLLVIGTLWAAIAIFPLELGYPAPLMRTVWYPLHVPLSFLSYGLWTAAAVGAANWLWKRDEAWLALVDRLALQGFAVWTLSMICGGFWGVVAWGAYFMWDPKVIWSVILWFHYGSFVHLNRTPSLARRPFARPLLALVGFAWVFVAYVGTSFFFGRSSHAW
ncbi:MAG: cytochrome c biogenesis protein CcsA [Deltaproteobacteria bacterium]|nr:cytochrome c biogenesis protein CcsA [Deltaproteobacteria bacterium]